MICSSVNRDFRIVRLLSVDGLYPKARDLSGGASGDGNDRFIYRSGSDSSDDIHGGQGSDLLINEANRDMQLANFSPTRSIEILNAGGFRVIGNGSANNLDFSATNLVSVASIDGGGGNDSIYGSDGDDRIAGGNGNDVISFGGAASGNDAVLDFDQRGNDVLRLIGLGPDFDTFAEIIAVTTQVGADLRLDFGAGGSLTLLNSSLSSLTMDDIVFG